MKGLLKHLLNTKRDEILAKSLVHCHAVNLHSVMLIDKPESRVRMFIADEGHNLWFNRPASNDSLELIQSIAFHPHHCEVTLDVFKGRLGNWVVIPRDDGELTLNKFRYKSKILSPSDHGFHREGEEKLHSLAHRQWFPGEYVYMPARTIHSVYVPKDEVCAWFVYEGREDPNYQSVCWSNATAISTEGLYQPMNWPFLRQIMAKVGVLLK